MIQVGNMGPRTLVLTPPRNGGYRDLCLEDSRKRGVSPVALRIDSPQVLRLAERWIDVAERLVVYGDFGTPDEALGLIADAEALGVEVEVEERTLGKRPARTVRERIAELVS